MDEIQFEPRWMYHAKEKARLVSSPEELEALGKGWREMPFPENHSDTRK